MRLSDRHHTGTRGTAPKPGGNETGWQATENCNVERCSAALCCLFLVPNVSLQPANVRPLTPPFATILRQQARRAPHRIWSRAET